MEELQEEDVQSTLLCPGFTHRNVVEIAETARENVGIFPSLGTQDIFYAYRNPDLYSKIQTGLFFNVVDTS